MKLIKLKTPSKARAADLYLISLATGSRPAAQWRIKTLESLLASDIESAARAGYNTLLELRDTLRQGYAPATANAMLATLRGVLRHAWLNGDLDRETYARACELPAVIGNKSITGRWLYHDELRSLFAACPKSNAGARDKALLALLFGAGLRRSEVTALELANIKGDTIQIEHSKGHKSREVAMSSSVRRTLEHWTAKLETGLAIRSVNKGDRILERGMSGEAIRKRLKVIANRAGVDNFRPHDARRNYASTLLDRGADLAVVARLMGHANVQVTFGYDRRLARAEAEAAGLIRLPDELGEEPTEADPNQLQP